MKNAIRFGSTVGLGQAVSNPRSLQSLELSFDIPAQNLPVEEDQGVERHVDRGGSQRPIYREIDQKSAYLIHVQNVRAGAVILG